MGVQSPSTLASVCSTWNMPNGITNAVTTQFLQWNLVLFVWIKLRNEERLNQGTQRVWTEWLPKFLGLRLRRVKWLLREWTQCFWLSVRNRWCADRRPVRWGCQPWSTRWKSRGRKSCGSWISLPQIRCRSMMKESRWPLRCTTQAVRWQAAFSAKWTSPNHRYHWLLYSFHACGW